jgi:hypothetical protein
VIQKITDEHFKYVCEKVQGFSLAVRELYGGVGGRHRFTKGELCEILLGNFMEDAEKPSQLDVHGYDLVINGHKVSVKGEDAMFKRNGDTKQFTLKNFNSNQGNYEVEYDYIIILSVKKGKIALASKGAVNLTVQRDKIQGNIKADDFLWFTEVQVDDTLIESHKSLWINELKRQEEFMGV